MTITELYDIIVSRRAGGDSSSYTASLFADGLDRIAQKVGEEAIETVIAAKNDDREEFIGEAADLLYHLLVLLAAKDVAPTEIEQKLAERHAQKTAPEESK